MIILGIDPGTTRIGYGLIRRKGGAESIIDFGVIETKGNSQEKLLQINGSIEKIIGKYKPELAGLETLFFSTNKKTALAVAESRGAIILTLLKHKLKILEFPPNNIKSVITGYGKSDKKSVQKIIEMRLNIKNRKLPDDAYDALAIALRASLG